MTSLIEPPNHGDSPRKPWPFPASALHRQAVAARGLCSPAKRAACNPETATCAGAAACAEQRLHIAALLRPQPLPTH